MPCLGLERSRCTEGISYLPRHITQVEWKGWAGWAIVIGYILAMVLFTYTLSVVEIRLNRHIKFKQKAGRNTLCML